MFGKTDREQAPKETAGRPSILAPGSVFEGDLTLAGPATLSGVITGDITSNFDIVIDAGAQVTGTLVGASFIIGGLVRGAVRASGTVELQSSADFDGDLQAGDLIVAQGAKFQANLKMSSSTSDQISGPADSDEGKVPFSDVASAFSGKPVTEPTK